MQYNYFGYTTDKLPPYGSVVYFAYRKLSETKKETLYLLDQLKSQIISCTELFSNPEVTIPKTHWWIGQINALVSDESVSSPQLKKLAEIFDNEILHKHLSADINHSFANELDEKGFMHHAQNNFLGIETLKAMYLSDFGEVNSDTIKQLNINNEIVRNIFCMPKHFHNHIINDVRINNQLSKNDLDNLIAEWLTGYKTVKPSKKLRPLSNINKIHRRMLNKYSKTIIDPFIETIEFSPLSLLFYSV